MTMASAIHIRGQVQGVGFRPFIWHLATELGIRGSVCNDAGGVLIHAWGDAAMLDSFTHRMLAQLPSPARIDALESRPLASETAPDAFSIIASQTAGRNTVSVTPDAAICPDCLTDILSQASRHYGYPFTSCTHCGPRLSIVRKIPYDRANTSMAAFPMCPECSTEYSNPADRRFHAQTHACPACGPQVWLQDASGNRPIDGRAMDIIAFAARLLRDGNIIAIKGIGGIHLAADAGNDAAVEQLRTRKQRDAKPFALMAADIESLAEYAALNDAESQLLQSTAAPIVLLDRRTNSAHLAAAVAPDQSRLGFMLPYSPLHSLLMRQMDRPIVLTSGNLSDEPQCIDNPDAVSRLSGIADYFLLNDRDIVNRLDDSVAAVMAGYPRLLRRARGYAPEPVLLHASLSAAPRLLAMGGEMKSTFCLLDEAQAIVSQHLGDLEHASTHHDYRKTLDLYAQIYGFTPQAIAVDMHPDYLSTRIGLDMAKSTGIPVVAVQHHHAHVAAVLAEHRVPLGSAAVLGIALDGLGFGEDGTIWGGEFLLADYATSRRLGCFQPVAMPGGTQAIREPWRNTFAHLHGMGWDKLEASFGDSNMLRFLSDKPLAVLHSMLEKKLNSPLTSSCGRLFDAVAASLGICRHKISYEGQAAIELESLARGAYSPSLTAFPYRIETIENDILQINWQPMWEALLAEPTDMDRAVIAARFHRTASAAICEMTISLCNTHATNSAVLCGGSFQNRLLLETIVDELGRQGLSIYTAERMPMGDGGLALGQACVAAARLIQGYPND